MTPATPELLLQRNSGENRVESDLV
jgi:hypothetical protein